MAKDTFERASASVKENPFQSQHSARDTFQAVDNWNLPDNVLLGLGIPFGRGDGVVDEVEINSLYNAVTNSAQMGVDSMFRDNLQIIRDAMYSDYNDDSRVAGSRTLSIDELDRYLLNSPDIGF